MTKEELGKQIEALRIAFMATDVAMSVVDAIAPIKTTNARIVEMRLIHRIITKEIHKENPNEEIVKFLLSEMNEISEKPTK